MCLIDQFNQINKFIKQVINYIINKIILTEELASQISTKKTRIVIKKMIKLRQNNNKKPHYELPQKTGSDIECTVSMSISMSFSASGTCYIAIEYYPAII